MTASPAQLDPKIATRNVDFGEALKLLSLLDGREITYTELFKLAISNRVVIDKDGQPLKKSSFHRNWKTLEVLSLLTKDGRFHKATEQGNRVMRVFAEEGMIPGEKTKCLLRQAMLVSEIVRQNFFALFATDQTHAPLEYPAAIALVPELVEGSNPGSKRYQIQNIVTEFKYLLEERQVNGVIWGLGGWALQIGLVDQLYARPQDGIAPALSKICFLVNPDRPQVNIARSFEIEMENLIRNETPVYGKTARLPISRLFYRICPSTQVNTVVARQLLTQWLHDHKDRAFVEGASESLVQNTRLTTRSGARISWKRQEPALLELGGRYYTYLFCQQL